MDAEVKKTEQVKQDAAKRFQAYKEAIDKAKKTQSNYNTANVNKD